MTKDEVVGWYHQLNEREFEQAPGVGDGQGGLVCCSPWGCKESDTTELLNWNRIGSLRIKGSGDGRRWREQLTQRLEQFVKLVTSVFVVESDKTWTFRGFGGYGACV